MTIRKSVIASLFVYLLIVVSPGFSQESDTSSNGDVAKKLANPVCAIIAVPIEYERYRNDVGVYNGNMDIAVIKPVVPFKLNDDWAIISRTIVPYVWQDEVVPSKVTKFGMTLDTKNQLGYEYAGKNNGFWDIQEQLFVSPSKKYYGFLWGLGTVLGFPGSKNIAGSNHKYTAGPSGAIVREDGICTYGFLLDHQWSYAGEKKDYAVSGSEHALAGYPGLPADGLDLSVEAEDVSKTFVQPFFTLRFPTYTGLSFTSESTYDWKSEKWSVPLIGIVSQIVKIGPQILQFKLGAVYWYKYTDETPNGWGVRAGVTLLYQI